MKKNNELEILLTNKEFDSCISKQFDLFNIDVFEIENIYISLMACIANNDIKKAKLILNMFVLGYKQNIFEKEENAFFNIKGTTSENVVSLIIIKYISDLKIDDSIENAFIKYYQIIDTIYEVGFDRNIIDYLNEIGSIVFKK